MSFPLPLDTRPMEAQSANTLPEARGLWQYEPKWDGFPCVAFKADDSVDLRTKSGKPMARYFPEVLAFLQQMPVKQLSLMAS